MCRRWIYSNRFPMVKRRNGMTKRVFMFVFSVFVLTAMFGCGGPKSATEPLEAPGDLTYEQLNTRERFRKFKSIGIRPFSTEGVIYQNTDQEEMAEMEAFVSTAPQHIITGFMGEMKDNYYQSYGVVKDDEDAKNYDLVIDGVFLQMDRGNAAGRFWGVGGAASVTVRGTMTETATGTVVVNFNDTKIDTRSLGTEYLLGDCCKEVGGNLSDFLEEVY